MKALVCHTFGSVDSLSLEDIPAPTPKPNEVLVRVFACGLSFPDLLIIQNKYQFKPQPPFSPGGEVAGIVEATGEHVKHLTVGDKVVAFCRWGGLAEKVVADVNRVFKMPQGMDFISGASSLYTFGTSLHALKDRAQLKSGETLLILGSGSGVGLAAVSLAKLMGATVIAAASSKEKLQACKAQGADHLINYTDEDLRARLREITREKGVDVAYDAVGGKLAEPALRSMAWGGRYLVVGFASGEIPTFPANLPLLKGCSIVGVFWSGFVEHEPESNAQNLSDITQWLKAGKIKQHIHKIYTLSESRNALQDLANRKVTGKAVVKVGEWNQD